MKKEIAIWVKSFTIVVTSTVIDKTFLSGSFKPTITIDGTIWLFIPVAATVLYFIFRKDRKVREQKAIVENYYSISRFEILNS